MMEKKSFRTCPICEEINCEILHTLKFLLPKGHPLSDGYDVVCCNRCGFVYADTITNQQDYDAFYTNLSKYEDNKTSTGGGESSWDADRFQKTADCIAKYVPDKNKRILDIGCANGGLLKFLKKKGYTNLFGLDPSHNCAENTKKLGIEAYVGTLSDLPKDIGYFDVVILSYVLEHVQDVRDALIVVKSILNSNGKFYIEVPDASRYADFYVSPFHYFDTEHINHFSLHSLGNLLSVSGFKSISSGFKTVHITSSVMYPAIWAMCIPNSKKSNFRFDDGLKNTIKCYIALSSYEFENETKPKINNLITTGQPLIIWGVGCATTRLLASSLLAQANIVAFVDNNPKYHGSELKSKPVIAPTQLIGRDEAIVITSKLYAPQIMKQITDDLKLPNKTILI